MGVTAALLKGRIAMTVVATSTSGVTAGPAQPPPRQPAAAPLSHPPPRRRRRLLTSFEDGQPQPEVSTVEVGPDGPAPAATSPAPASADGSLLGSVVGVTASAENAPGEVAANLADANPDSKWLAFASTGWVRYQLGIAGQGRPLLADLGQRRARSATRRTSRLQGSNDGTTWTDLDTPDRHRLPRPLRHAHVRRDDARRRTRYYRLNVTAIHSRRHRPARRLGPQRRLTGTGAGDADGDQRRRRARSPASTSSRSSAGPASRRCATPAATPPTAVATPGTGSSTSTCP